MWKVHCIIDILIYYIVNNIIEEHLFKLQPTAVNHVLT